MVNRDEFASNPMVARPWLLQKRLV